MILGRLIRQRSPWKEVEEVEHTLEGDLRIRALRDVYLHVPSHLFCLVVFVLLLAGYAAYSVYRFINEPVIETFSSVPADQFKPVPLQVTVDCAACGVHAKNGRRWAVISDYSGLEHCSDVATGTLADEPSSTVTLCRSTVDISDKLGIRIRLENVSFADRTAIGRPSIRVVTAGDSGEAAFAVTTPMEPWHEKTILLGLEVRRDEDDCTSEEQCSLTRSLYLASMQYDGSVKWGGVTWGGGLLHIRMLRFAHVYTRVPPRTPADVLAALGGASSLLLLVLGPLRKAGEVLHTAGCGGRREAASNVAKAAATAGTQYI